MNKPLRNRDEMSPLQGEIFDFVVAYNAFMDALGVEHDKRVRQDHNSIVIWGRILEKSQAFFGIELFPSMLIRERVREAEQAMAQIDKIMHGEPSDI